MKRLALWVLVLALLVGAAGGVEAGKKGPKGPLAALSAGTIEITKPAGPVVPSSVTFRVTWDGVAYPYMAMTCWQGTSPRYYKSVELTGVSGSVEYNFGLAGIPANPADYNFWLMDGGPIRCDGEMKQHVITWLPDGSGIWYSTPVQLAVVSFEIGLP